MAWKKHVLLWLIMLLLGALLVPALSSSADIMRRVLREIALIESALGKKETAEITQSASAVYRSLFLETGLIDATRKAVVTKEEQRSSEGIFGGSVTKMSDATNDYILGLSALCFASLVRIMIFGAWAPYMLPFFIAVIADGMARRQIKMVTFGYVSPVLYSLALHSMITIVFLPLLYLIVPIPLSPILIPFWALFAAIPMMAMISNTQRLGG